MEKIGVVGVGKLGLCMALIFEKAGYNVISYEKNTQHAEAIKNKTLQSVEPGVKPLLHESKKISITSLEDIYTLPIIFVVVATPSLPNGSYNHSAVDNVIEELLMLNKNNPDYKKKTLVISCTTMPKYCESVQKRLEEYNYDVCYNPEFIAQGDIIHGLKNPDMVLIGHTNQDSCEKVIKVYKQFLENTPTFHTMALTEAEITKISLNCFLTTKIAFANTIGDIVIKAGGNQDVVLKAIGSDSRVGGKFLKWGHGFGGPCLPRDNRALSFFSKSINIVNDIGNTTDISNKKHLENLFYYIKKINSENKPIFFNSIVYKKNTYILEESQKLELALLCVKNHLEVIIHDDEKVLNELQTKYKNDFVYLFTLVGNEMTIYFDINQYIS